MAKEKERERKSFHNNNNNNNIVIMIIVQGRDEGETLLLIGVWMRWQLAGVGRSEGTQGQRGGARRARTCRSRRGSLGQSLKDGVDLLRDRRQGKLKLVLEL